MHPFREGNGRAQEAFISELGRHYGREIDFSVITKPRMIEASIETTNDPSSPAMKHVIEDAMNPARREAIRSAREVGEEPLQHHVRTARPGEEITGTVLGHDDRFASLVTGQGIVVADPRGSAGEIAGRRGNYLHCPIGLFPPWARAAGPGGEIAAAADEAATAGP